MSDFSTWLSAAALLVAIIAFFRARSATATLHERDKAYRESLMASGATDAQLSARVDGLTQRFDLLVFACYRPLVIAAVSDAQRQGGERKVDA